MCDTIYDKYYENKDYKCIISLVAHNGHKADYPLIMKSLLNDKRYTLISQCASGMAKISYKYSYNNNKFVTIQFVDSMNLYKGSLEDFGKAMGLSIEK